MTMGLNEMRASKSGFRRGSANVLTALLFGLAGGALALTIEDTGCGIPRAALAKIGQPFEQVQNQLTKSHAGSGLGLAISRSLAELHGGALKIRSREGVCTIVSVRIPMSELKVSELKAA